jgi:glutathione S-transferase
MELGYWGNKAITEPIRWLLCYLQADHITEYNPSSAEEWFNGRRAEVGGPFPNMPYFKDDDYVLTESAAIPVYICVKLNREDLLGKTIEDKCKVRQIEGVLNDMRIELWTVLFSGEMAQELHQMYLLPEHPMSQKAAQMAKFLGQKEWLLGYFSYADILLAYYAELSTAIAASLGQRGLFDIHDNVRALVKRVRAIPKIKLRTENSKDVPYMPPGMFGFHFMTRTEVEDSLPDDHHC